MKSFTLVLLYSPKNQEEACGWNRCAWAYADEHSASGLAAEVKGYVKKMNCPPPGHEEFEKCVWFQTLDKKENRCQNAIPKVRGFFGDVFWRSEDGVWRSVAV